MMGEVEKEAETEKEEGGVGQGRRSCRATHGKIIIVTGVINIIAQLETSWSQLGPSWVHLGLILGPLRSQKCNT